MSTMHAKYKKRSRKLSKKQLYGIAATVVVVVSLLAVYSFYNQPNTSGSMATIIDQLSSMEGESNATFVEAAKELLTTAGYGVNYYKGSDVTVDFFQQLPTDGFQILIFRVHSALRLDKNGSLGSPLDFFTSEPYSNATHATYQIEKWLDIAVYNGTDNKNEYFGINPGFVTNAMDQGSFQNATIILMGCNGLDGQNRSESMLQALVDRGAKVIIGWNASVSMPHTDTATDDLLYNLFAENETVKEAINATNHEIGPDPDIAYKNELLYYPSRGAPFYCGVDVGNYTIPHGVSKSATAKTSSNYILPLISEGVPAVPLLLSVPERRAFRKLEERLLQSHSVSKP